jgi:hypothetical protein
LLCFERPTIIFIGISASYWPYYNIQQVSWAFEVSWPV